MGAQWTWYNDRRAVIIPAHTGFRACRGNPGAKFRRRPMAAQRTWYNKAVGIRHKKRRSSDEQRIDF